jgi:uncharacterized membrane protein YphA (DoxX/SURF4 family)
MKSENNRPKSRIISFWITTTVIAIIYFITGLGNILPVDHIARDMAHLGYPTYFLKIIGVWKMLGAIVVVIPKIPRIKEWAYAGMIFDLSGAAFSRFTIGDPLPQIIIPLCLATLVTVNYLLRHSLRYQTNL